MIRSKPWFVAMALFATAAGADDQASPLSTLAPGDRVRVKVVGSRETLTSTIDSVTADELILSPAGAGLPLRFSFGQLDRLEVARGRRTQWAKGAVIGLIPGAVLGGLAGVGLACDPEVSGGCEDEATFVAGSGLVGAVVGGAATAAVGALVGLAFKADRWVRVHDARTRVSLILAPTGGGMRAGLSINF